jgi:hypothetical protein
VTRLARVAFRALDTGNTLIAAAFLTALFGTEATIMAIVLIIGSIINNFRLVMKVNKKTPEFEIIYIKKPIL